MIKREVWNLTWSENPRNRQQPCSGSRCSPELHTVISFHLSVNLFVSLRISLSSSPLERRSSRTSSISGLWLEGCRTMKETEEVRRLGEWDRVYTQWRIRDFCVLGAQNIFSINFRVGSIGYNFFRVGSKRLSKSVKFNRAYFTFKLFMVC